MASSVYDLTFDYLNRFYEKEEMTDTLKREVYVTLYGLLMEGWTDEELIREMNFFEKQSPDCRPYSFFNWMMSRSGNKKNENLIDPRHFYYHNELRILPPPPKRYFDYNEGIVKKIETEYFLEMRSSYTVFDLIQYYYKQFAGKVDANRDSRRMVGAFKHMLRFHTLEEILFMIDVASNLVVAGDIVVRGNEPFFIEEHKAQAMLAYHEKKTEAVQAGDDKVVPKKRVLLGRSGYRQRLFPQEPMAT